MRFSISGLVLGLASEVMMALKRKNFSASKRKALRSSDDEARAKAGDGGKDLGTIMNESFPDLSVEEKLKIIKRHRDKLVAQSKERESINRSAPGAKKAAAKKSFKKKNPSSPLERSSKKKVRSTPKRKVNPRQSPLERKRKP
jgi:hypothetical protein